MKTLIVTPVYEPYYNLGGPAKSVPRLVKVLKQMDLEVSVHTVSHGHVSNHKNGVLYYHTSRLDSILNLFARTKHPMTNLIFGVINTLHKTDYIILNCGFYLPNVIIGLYATYILKDKKIIFIPRGAGSEKRRKTNQFLKSILIRLENLYLKHHTLIKLDSREEISCYNPKRMIQIPNILDINHLENGQRPIDCIFVGRPELEKGIDKFLKLAKVNRNKQFLIIATHQNSHIERAKNLQNTLVMINPSSKVIKKNLEKSKLFFLHSAGEGLSMALLEAVERGAVPLCNDAALSNYFRGVQGLMVIPENECGQDQFIKYLGDNLTTVREKLRAKVKEHFSEEAVEKLIKMENLF